MTEVTWFVPNIRCGHCTRSIETELSELVGVQTVKADKDSRKVTVGFVSPATEETIKVLLSEIGYPVEVQ